MEKPTDRSAVEVLLMGYDHGVPKPIIWDMDRYHDGELHPLITYNILRLELPK